MIVTTAVETHGGVWNGNGCQLEEGATAIKHQLQQMKAAQQAKEQFAIQQLKLNIELQTVRACIDTGREALTQTLRSNDYEGVAAAIVALVEATARWFRAGGR